MKNKSKKFVFSVIGSQGDFNPVLAIALELKRRGHNICIASIDIYKDKVEKSGIKFIELRPRQVDLGPIQEQIEKSTDLINGIEYVIREWAMPHISYNYYAIEDVAKDADVLINQLFTYSMPIVAEKLKKPWVTIVLQPFVFFSAYDPSVLPPFPWIKNFSILGPWVYSILFKLIKAKMKPWSAPWLEFRTKLGLPYSKKNPFFEGQFSSQMTIALFSESFAKAQIDWPINTVHAGFPTFLKTDLTELSDKVKEFIDRGEAPLVFTLGTAMVRNAGDFYLFAARATIELKKRAILLIGPDYINREQIPDHPSICISNYESFGLLFPKALIIIHQGGVGTMSQAMQAGIPQIICPFSHDQPDNAYRATKIGGALTIAKKKMTVDNFVKNIQEILSNEKYFISSREFAQKITEEDGIKKSADLLENYQ